MYFSISPSIFTITTQITVLAPHNNIYRRYKGQYYKWHATLAHELKLEEHRELDERLIYISSNIGL